MDKIISIDPHQIILQWHTSSDLFASRGLYSAGVVVALAHFMRDLLCSFHLMDMCTSLLKHSLLTRLNAAQLHIVLQLYIYSAYCIFTVTYMNLGHIWFSEQAHVSYIYTKSDVFSIYWNSSACTVLRRLVLQTVLKGALFFCFFFPPTFFLMVIMCPSCNRPENGLYSFFCFWFVFFFCAHFHFLSEFLNERYNGYW